MNNALKEIKNTLEGTKSRITETEDRISEVEDKMVEINEAERKKEKRIKRNEDNLSDLWDNVKRPNIRIIGVPEEDKKGVPLLIVTGVTVVICVTRLPKPSRNVIQSRTGQWSMVGEPAESCELPRGQEQVSRAFTPP